MPYKSSELLSTIEEPSLGSKNISKGLWAEEVVKQKLIDHRCEFLFQRKKLKFGEVDLAFKKNQKIYFIEVKLLHNSWMAFERLHAKQKQRLLLNAICYGAQAYLCFVEKNKKITFVEIN